MTKKEHTKEDELIRNMAILEAVLFTMGDPIKKKRLAKVCGFHDALLKKVLHAYQEEAKRARRGLSIMEHNDAVQLVTAPETQSIVEKMLADSLSEDLSRAALEVLAIVAYRGPVSRMEVDAIRGVNCSFSLRGLAMRGLIERVSDPEHPRTYLYRVTHDFLSHLGLTRIEELPDFEALNTHPKIDQVKGV